MICGKIAETSAANDRDENDHSDRYCNEVIDIYLEWFTFNLVN